HRCIHSFPTRRSSDLVQGYLKMQLQFQLWVTQLLDFLGLIILRLSVYVILTMKIIYMAILAMMGPIAVGFSILPAFRDSFNSWIDRKSTRLNSSHVKI